MSFKSIKVLTLNTWLLRTPLGIDLARSVERRLKIIPDRVCRFSPDIILLQEVWHPALRARLHQEFSKRGYAFSNWNSANEKNLCRRDFLLNFCSPHKLKELSKQIMQNGLMIFSKFPLNPQLSTLVFSEHTRADEVFVKKGAIKMQVLLPELGWADVYNAHLGAVTFDSDSNAYIAKECEARKKQTHELATWIRKTRDSEFQIVGADLNSHYHGFKEGKYHDKISDEYSMMTGRGNYGAGLVDSFTSHHGLGPNPGYTDESKNPYRQSGPFANSPDAVLDYVFVSDSRHLTPSQSQLVFNEDCVSDHYGVLSEFAIA